MTLDDIVAKVTDPYDRQARLYPALLCLLPLLALVALLYAPNVSALNGSRHHRGVLRWIVPDDEYLSRNG